MKKLLFIFACIANLVSTKAQTYVTIPDANFVTWLQTNVPSAMNGNQMDITSTAVTSRLRINLYFLSINDLTGIEHFTSLKVLDCSLNYGILSLPVLSNTIDSLFCEGIGAPINSLPVNLIHLKCGSSNLNYLPPLPSTLLFLDISNGNFTLLPSLPASLKYLRVNSVTNANLPSFPNTLESLVYSAGPPLTKSLPPLPSNLKNLNIFGINIVPSLQLPNSLKTLYLSENGLINISSPLPDSLQIIDLSMLPNISLPPLPNNLKKLSLYWTYITSLPNLPNSLQSFDCSLSKSLTAIPDLPKGLKHFNCSACPLITCIPPLPNSLETIALSDSITCLPNYVSAMPPSYFNYPICEPNNSTTNPYNCPKALGISGNTYFDVNTNCINELSDTPLKNITLKLKDSTNTVTEFLSSGVNGSYTLWESAGIYTVSLDTLNKPYKGYCHSNGVDTSVVLTSLQPNADSVNFSIKCKTGFDVGVQSVLTTGWVFPGQVHHLKINAGDMAKWFGLNCAAGISGQMVVNVLGAVHYSTSAVGALAPMVSGNTFTFTISDFGTLNNLTDFDLVFQTDTTANVGDSICVSITMTPTLGDINLSNNTYHYCYQVINSHDPNKKEVYPIDVLPNYQDWFTYTIHFQNTGSAPAMNIRFKDTLDANLNLETFEVINYSHQNTWQLYKNLLVFNFQNIQLPDSTSNPEGSKGFVQYRIKPKANRPFGSQIKNTAYIYFDYNAPIITNTTINHFTTPASINENFINKTVSIYPNPTTGIFSIQLNSTEKHNLEVLDMTGKLVIQHIIEDGHALIDGDSLSNGIYSIKVSNNSGSITKKLVIVK